MKKNRLIALICSLIAVAVISAAVILILFFSGVISFEKTNLVISSASASKVYDAKELKDRSWNIESGELRDGHTIEVLVTGSQTMAGNSVNTVKAVIRDKNGADVSDEYNISYKPGVLNVKERSITIIAESDMKSYDGSPLTASGYSVASDDALLPKHKLEVTVEGSVTDIGRTENLITKVVIYNEKGEDVTGNYNVKPVSGKLIVYSADSIVIQSGSATKEYDGTELTCGEWELVSGQLLDGDQPWVEVYGTRTEVGTSDNEFDVIIKDADDNVVTFRYTIVKSYGTLTVTEKLEDERIPLEFETGGAGKSFDGNPLTNGNWEISGDLLLGHNPEVTVTGSQTDVGSSFNSATVKIVDDSGRNVTELYNIKTEFGVLEVSAMPVEIVSDSNQKTYDGEPLTDFGFSVLPSTLLDNFNFSVDVIGSQTYVGTSDNIIDTDTLKITDADGNDVTGNFDISFSEGELTVVQNPDDIRPVLVYATESDSKFYDGTPLINQNGERISGELKEGHYEVIEMTATATDVGDVPNKIEVTIFDLSGNDVTDEYVIESGENIGTLTVFPREITITAGSAEKEYDGTPLTSDEAYITPSDGLVDGHEIEITLSGSRLYEGVGVNTVSSYKITDAEGNDVSGNYEVNKTDGTLTVTGSDNYNMGLPMNPGAPITYFEVKTNVDDIVYLKERSYGDYVVGTNSWEQAPVYSVRLPNGESMFFLTSYAIDNSGLSTNNIEITPVMKDAFALPYYSVGDLVKLSTDVTIIGNTNAQYNLSYYNWDSVAGVFIPRIYADAELLYREHVYDTYLQIDDQTLAFMNEIIAENNLNPNAADIINKVANYIKRSARYNLEYNRALDSEENSIIAFLSEYKEGVCQHYAAAATLLFRALGIPARFTVGFASPVKAGVKTDVTTESAHAWVEVYVDEIGWINVEVTGSGNAATGTNAPKELTIAPVYTGEVYDGQTLEAMQMVSGMTELEREGYTYEAVVTGSNSELGIVKSEVSSFKIYDSFGVLVYDKETEFGKDKFVISYQKGTIQLYLSELKFTSPSYEKTYDGGELTFDVSEITVNGEIFDGYTYVISSITSITDAVQVSSKFKVDIYKDDVLCNDHYKISSEYGVLSILRRDLVLTAGSDTKAYDGTALVCDVLIYDQNQLVSGDEITDQSISGSQTNIGKSSNVIRSVTIKNADGKDVTENYKIVMNDGLLVVTRP